MKKSDVEKAQAVLDDLQAQRSALVARGHELEERRQAMAFAAHTGSKKERSQLDEINSEAITHDYELRSLDSALVEAAKRLAAAEQAQALAQEEENAHKLREALVRFQAHAEAIDVAFAAVTKEAQALEEVLKLIHTLGCTFPSRAQLDALGARAFKTAAMNTPWRKEFEHLAPSERQSFPELVSLWASRIENNHISPRIGLMEVA